MASWVRGVLPAVVDVESSLVDKCVEAVEQLLDSGCRSPLNTNGVLSSVVLTAKTCDSLSYLEVSLH